MSKKKLQFFESFFMRYAKWDYIDFNRNNKNIRIFNRKVIIEKMTYIIRSNAMSDTNISFKFLASKPWVKLEPVKCRRPFVKALLFSF